MLSVWPPHFPLTASGTRPACAGQRGHVVGPAEPAAGWRGALPAAAGRPRAAAARTGRPGGQLYCGHAQQRGRHSAVPAGAVQVSGSVWDVKWVRGRCQVGVRIKSWGGVGWVLWGVNELTRRWGGARLGMWQRQELPDCGPCVHWNVARMERPCRMPSALRVLRPAGLRTRPRAQSIFS